MEFRADSIKDLTDRLSEVFKNAYNKVKDLIAQLFSFIRENYTIFEEAHKRELAKQKYLKRCRNRQKLYTKRKKMGWC